MDEGRRKITKRDQDRFPLRLVVIDELALFTTGLGGDDKKLAAECSNLFRDLVSRGRRRASSSWPPPRSQAPTSCPPRCGTCSGSAGRCGARRRRPRTRSSGRAGHPGLHGVVHRGSGPGVGFLLSEGAGRFASSRTTSPTTTWSPWRSGQSSSARPPPSRHSRGSTAGGRLCLRPRAQLPYRRRQTSWGPSLHAVPTGRNAVKGSLTPKRRRSRREPQFAAFAARILRAAARRVADGATWRAWLLCGVRSELDAAIGRRSQACAPRSVLLLGRHRPCAGTTRQAPTAAVRGAS